MNAKQLKNALLQHAIQGRLVPQDPGDEPADVLLQRIRAEKEQLIKEGKIKKQKSLPPITEEEKPFTIPDSWQWVRLNSIYLFIDYRGMTPQKISSGIPFITAKNIKDGFIDYTIKDFISIEDYKKRQTRGVSKKDDILFTTEAPLGNTALADIDTFSAGQRVITLQQFSPKNIFLNKLIMLFFLSPYFKSQLDKYKTGTTVYGIKADKLKQILIPFPPLAEQQRIVARLEELLPDVKAYGTAQERLTAMESSFPQQLRKSLLQEAIQGRLVPQDPDDESADVLLQRIHAEKEQLIKEGKIKKQKPLPPITEEEKPFAIPDSWQWVRLGEIVTINPRNSLSDDLEVSFIPMNLIKDGYGNSHTSEIRIWKTVKSCFTHFAENDIAIAKITPCFQNRKSAILSNLKNGFGAGTTELHIVRIFTKLLIHKYFLYIFKTEMFISQGMKSFTGTAGQQRIGKDFISLFPIPLPPLAEQQRIVARLEELLPLCDGILSAGGQA